ncbi:unnamed protein product [Paramecium primaurelia]|uniref:Protein kinase domain-containing protein n=1 Tax=Paramecium primaurelia TaxID=5886 RepID=A0A8S1PRW6_PARPR|nr:unnamed protein product [Paramecium primaurelia]
MDQKQKVQSLMNNYVKKEMNRSGVVNVKIYLNNELLHSIQFPTLNQTTQNLVNHLKSLINSPLIIGFQTIDQNIPLDFYLTQNYDLGFLTNQTIQLKPLNSIQQALISLDSFYFLQCIGVGGFSRVYLVRCKSNGQFMALKMISKQFIQEHDKFQIIQNERNIMVALAEQSNSHPFLCKLLSVFETKSWVCFALEYCPGGELFQQLKRVKRMDEQQAKFYFSQVCLAIHHLHENGIIYRDIKPENILIDQDGNIKLADFGLARPNMKDDLLAFSFCGSPEYMAPEMLLKSGHNYQIDHYCLGALLYELLTGLPPYYSNNPEQIYKNILQHDLTLPNKNCSAESRDLMQKLLQKDVFNRLGKEYGIYEILKHPWLQDKQLYKILNRQYEPPFKPDLLKMNFDYNEITKGENNFQRDLQKSLNSDNENVFSPFFSNFYFSSIIQKSQTRSASITQINSSNIDDKINNLLVNNKSKNVLQTHTASQPNINYQLKQKKVSQERNSDNNKENIMKNFSSLITKTCQKHKKNNQSMPDQSCAISSEMRSLSTQKIIDTQKVPSSFNTTLLKSQFTETDEDSSINKTHKTLFGEAKSLNKNFTNQCTLLRFFKQ